MGEYCREMRDQLLPLLVSSSVERHVRLHVGVGGTGADVPRQEHKQVSGDGLGARVDHRSFVDLWGRDGDGQVDARPVCQVEVRFPQVRGEGKERRGGAVWQPSGPAEKCVVMKSLVRTLLEEFVWRFACRASDKGVMDRRPTHP
jgi:hypothetical protein